MTLNETSPIAVAGTTEPHGIGGWLTLLCVGLTILNPLLTVANVTSGLAQGSAYVGALPNWGLYLYLDAALSLVVATISFIAGFRMWREVPGADRLAKVALGLIAVYSLLCYPLIAAMHFPPELQNAATKELNQSTGRAVLSSCIWLLYLYRSKRVANTFGPQPTRAVAGA